MPIICEGKKIPSFNAEATSGKKIEFKNLLGRPIVLYFYPKDSTPGCTLEGEDFRDNYQRFRQQQATIFGISRDNLNSHEKFKSKYNFPFELITDPDEKLCKLFDVIKEKNMYGKKYIGIERSTFLIDAQGVLRKEWRKVKVKGHVNDVLNAVKEL
jgi:peroxiredoxin Q/BCP